MAQPDLIPMPFAENATPGTIEPIQATTPTVPQDATWSSGFPQVTMQPLASGGIPPRGQNFNGVLNALSQHIFHTQGGGQYKWDAAHGPYSIGDVLQSDDGLRSYVSVVDNNTDNFNTTPGSIGVSWMPWSGGASSELVAGLIQLATTAEAQALTDDTKALTPKKLADSFSQNVFAHDQSIQNVTASRVLGTIYTNTTKKPIIVTIMANITGDPNNSYVALYVDENLAALCERKNVGIAAVSAVVPPGIRYRAGITAGTLTLWTEYR